MENPKKTRGDGVFGWPIGALTFCSICLGALVNGLFDTLAPMYVLGGLAVLVEVIHHKLRTKRTD